MIGNSMAWGNQGWVILEEGNINPQTLALDVAHYLVVSPAGNPVPGTFSLEEAKAWIETREPKASKNE